MNTASIQEYPDLVHNTGTISSPVVTSPNSVWHQRNQGLIASFFVIPLIYFCALRFLFPGYFAPLSPHHPDLFLHVGLTERPLIQVLTYARPVGFAAARLLGFLGLDGSIVAVIVLVFIGVLLTITFVARWSASAPSPLLIACYVLLLFAHPEFYFEHRHDFPAILSYIFLLLATDFWRRWLDTGRMIWVGGSLLFVLLLVLTKETYVGSLATLLIGMYFLVPNVEIRRVLPAFGAVALVTAAALGISYLGYLRWVAPVVGSAAAYRPAMNAGTVFRTWVFFLQKAVSWPYAVVLVVAFLLLARDRGRLKLAAFLLVAALSALIPNSLLANHTFEEYAWVAVPLMFAPLLLVANKMPESLVFVALTAFCLARNVREYRSPNLQWQVGEEKINANILASFPRLQKMGPGTRRILVTGLDAPLSPWLARDFVQHEFGNIEWTVVSPGERPDFRSAPVIFARADHVNLAAYDKAAIYGKTGRLIEVLSKTEIRKEAEVDPALLLAPEVRKYLGPHDAFKDDFADLLSAGKVLLDAGLFDRAEPLLKRAIAASDGKNAYPYFFLGQCAEAQGNLNLARSYFTDAVRADTSSSNPLFKESLDRLSPRH